MPSDQLKYFCTDLIVKNINSTGYGLIRYKLTDFYSIIVQIKAHKTDLAKMDPMEIKISIDPGQTARTALTLTRVETCRFL